METGECTLNIGDVVRILGLNDKRFAQVFKIFEGGVVIRPTGRPMIFRPFHEVEKVTDEEAMLWKLENL